MHRVLCLPLFWGQLGGLHLLFLHATGMENIEIHGVILHVVPNLMILPRAAVGQVSVLTPTVAI